MRVIRTAVTLVLMAASASGAIACTALFPLDDHRADDGEASGIDGGGSGDGGDGAVGADARRPNYVFVSSETFDPSTLGDREGGVQTADDACQALAADAGLGGTYVAYLSTSKRPAWSRLTEVGGWIRPDGKPFVRSKSDLLQGRILYPPRVDEHRNPLLNDVVATGHANDTGCSSEELCAVDWTSGNAGFFVGTSFAGASLWESSGPAQPGIAPHIYCFEIDPTIVASVSPTPSRRAFVSVVPFVPQPRGVQAADDECNAEAASHAWSATFMALLATRGSSAAGRFDLNGLPWARADGVLLVATARDLERGGDALLAPLNLTSDGAYVNADVWSGAMNPSVVSSFDCEDWTNPAATGTIPIGYSALSGNSLFWRGAGTGCTSKTTHLYCLEK